MLVLLRLSLPVINYTVKRLAIFPSPAGMSLTKLSLTGKNLMKNLTTVFLAMESLVSDIPAGYGKIANLFLQCMVNTHHAQKSKDKLTTTTTT
jgi:hypothetical protein